MKAVVHYVLDKLPRAPQHSKLKHGLISLSALLKHSCKLQSWANKSAAQLLTCKRGRDYSWSSRGAYWAFCSCAFTITAAWKYARNVGCLTTKKVFHRIQFGTPSRAISLSGRGVNSALTYPKLKFMSALIAGCALCSPEDLENILLIPQREMWWCLCSKKLAKNSQRFSENPITGSP